MHAVPELCMRFKGDKVRHYDQVDMSATVPTPDGSFNDSYMPFIPDFITFDRATARNLEETAKGSDLGANTGERDDLVYVSCLSWLDYTSLNNALPGPLHCIPRVSWGKFVRSGDFWPMAMTIKVHHALVDGQQVGAYFDAL